MKVLRIIDSMDPVLGGPGQGVRNTIPALRDLGVDCEVVSLDDPSAPFIKDDVFVTHAIGPASTPWHYGAKLVPWLLQNLERFDVVLVEGLWLYYSHAAGLAVRKYKAQNKDSKLRLLVMPHGMLDPYFQKAPDRKLKAIRNWIYWKIFESRVINNADGVMFTCEEELLLARQPFRPYKPKRELNVGFGIQAPPSFHGDMKREFQEACPAVKDLPFILFLSRINEKKGVDLLIEGYAAIWRPDVPKLVIAGPGLDTSYGKRVMAMVTERKLEHSVFFPGMLSGNKKWGAFYSCEAFVLCSHQENFGIAVVEALACHKPVLISNQVNIWKEIIREEAGLVGDDNIAGAENLLRSWINMSGEKKTAMIGRTRSVFEKLYAIEPAAKRLLQAFKTLNNN